MDRVRAGSQSQTRRGPKRPRARPYLHDVKQLLAAPRRRAGKGGRHLAALLFRSVRVSFFDPAEAQAHAHDHARSTADDSLRRAEQGEVLGADEEADDSDGSDDSEAGFASRAYLGAVEDEAAAYYARAQQAGTTVIPLRVRPAFILFTVLVMVVLAFLGFHPDASRWTMVNDKILHFGCFFVATALFYCIFDVDDRARKSSWFWRDAPLYLTLVTCFTVGSIGSEIVQSMLPYKTFQWGDVVANLLGSSLGMLASYRLEAHYRHRREIARLYRPVVSNLAGEGGLFSSDEDEEEADVLELMPPRGSQVVMGLQEELDLPSKPAKPERRVRWGGVEHFEPPAEGSAGPGPSRTLFSLDAGDDDEDETSPQSSPAR